MTRWHKPDCATPDVVVDASTPHCRSCNAVVSIDRIIAEHVAHQVPLVIPPDEPVGQMSLWWPPCVPYVSSHGDTLGEQQRDEVVPVANPTPPTPPSKASPSAYETTLSADEFRLARFDALQEGSSPDHPIHITLEVFRRDDCPEYETVSYTWGGEEDDSTLCRPVFVGPYWDVLPQTRNCWDMLRYLRPRRGVRLVWIDAICINQSDPAERGLQVASMRSVYQQCSRVVIYLGADIAATPPTSDIVARMHPPRHGLHDFERVMSVGLDGHENMALPDILTRRYFSRLWVVQELLLSRAAVIPIAGRDFWANNLTPIKYEDARKLANTPDSDREGWSWESSTAPWMRDLCRGSLHTEISFLDILRLTRRCRATDPRDKIFGVLGLAEPQTPSSSVSAGQPLLYGSASGPITPDYRISARHAYIGILAHTLLNHGVTDVLLGAAGLSAPLNHPSWLPRLDISERLRSGCSSHGYPPEDPPRFSVPRDGIIDMLTLATGWEEKQSVAGWKPKSHWVLLSLLRLPPLLAVRAAMFTLDPDDSFRDDDSFCGPRHGQVGVSPFLCLPHPWRATATVDVSTGALAFKAVHLVEFESCPRRIRCFDNATVLYEIQEGNCCLFFHSPEFDFQLETLFLPTGKNHLVYLEKDSDVGDKPTEFLLLFLRQVQGIDMHIHHDTRPNEFKVVLCCPCYNIFLRCPATEEPPGPVKQRQNMARLSYVNPRHSLYHVLITVLEDISLLDDTTVERSSNFTGRRLRLASPDKLFIWWIHHEPWIWGHMFPGFNPKLFSLHEILPFGQCILSSERSGRQDEETGNAFASHYIGFLNRHAQLKARLVHDRGADFLGLAWVEICEVSPVWVKPSAVLIPPVGEQKKGSEFAPPQLLDCTSMHVFRNWSPEFKSPWEWTQRDSSSSSGANHPHPQTNNQALWHSFSHDSESKGHINPDPALPLTVRIPLSEVIKFFKKTNMLRQMRRLHFMFRPPENSNERPPLKAKTWAGEEDETDMILRGPQEGDHFLPERPYRPWPEAIVRDFKADGVLWDITIS
ncbi:heterokaryon incompatibility protein-domain-containing protein [Podospora conica]|nr:heterokaryon incompatibility protein-domain-containing protein [Schizothecium conicum]